MLALTLPFLIGIESASASVQFQNGNSGVNCYPTTSTCTPFNVNTSTSTANNAVCLAVEHGGSTETITSVTIGGVTANKEGGGKAVTDGIYQGIWCAQGVPQGSSEAVTLNYSSQYPYVSAAVYTGVYSIDHFGGNNYAAATSLALTTTIGNSNSMMVGSVVNGSSLTAGSGTLVRETAGDPFVLVDSNTSQPAGSYTLNINAGSSYDWGAGYAVLESATSSKPALPWWGDF